MKNMILENSDRYFCGRCISIGDDIYNRIINKSYRVNDDISLSDLRYVQVMYYDYNHDIQRGEIIVNKDILDDTLFIFKELFRNEYELYSVRLVDDLWAGDPLTTDEASMRANNSSCFNYRKIAGKTYLSKHATGHAIDINPYENPYVRFDEDGKPICDGMSDEEIYYINNRNIGVSHVITHEDLAYKLFSECGFEWGGDWNPPMEPLDYQHFEKILIKK
ncbi:MAG: M15 family metallopeptidase [Firmicutes bacterium]|nr:M15 family metallopeptidase [Bacillota bacterium]